jgi:signal transduction histidine kinase
MADSVRSNQNGALPAGEIRIGHFYVDAKRKLLHCLNDAARQLISDGVPFTSADLAQHALSTMDGKKVQKEELPMRAALLQEKPIHAQFLLSRDPLPPLKLLWSASPVRNRKGKVVGVMGTVLAGALEPDWQALAGLAHDLRTPLQSMGLLIELAEGASKDQVELAELLPRIRASAQRSLSIAQHVLEWCRGPMRAGGTANREWVALEPFLTALAAEQAVAAQHKSLTLASNVAAAHEWEAYTDRIRLGRLLSNLLVNAVRYTKAGQVEFTASWRDKRNGSPVPGRKLVLSIVDTGAGIPEEEQESIFQPFERGRAGIEGDSGGSGLGLSIVDRLVEELGLELEVYSEYGHGSAFHLLLPDSSLRQVNPV